MLNVLLANASKMCSISVHQESRTYIRQTYNDTEQKMKRDLQEHDKNEMYQVLWLLRFSIKCLPAMENAIPEISDNLIAREIQLFDFSISSYCTTDLLRCQLALDQQQIFQNIENSSIFSHVTINMLWCAD